MRGDAPSRKTALTALAVGKQALARHEVGGFHPFCKEREMDGAHAQKTAVIVIPPSPIRKERKLVKAGHLALARYETNRFPP